MLRTQYLQAKSFLLGVLFALAMVEAAPALQGELIQLWDLAIRDQPGQMTVYNPDRTMRNSALRCAPAISTAMGSTIW